MPKKFSINKRVLVIGGGVAGIQAALDCADGGLEVILVEKTSSIGGKMAKLDKTFPTVDCSSCILGPKMVDVAQHPNITLYANSEIDEVGGYVGNFEVKIKKKGHLRGLGSLHRLRPVHGKVSEQKVRRCVQRASWAPPRPSIFPFPQAIPKKAIIDAKYCIKIDQRQVRRL